MLPVVRGERATRRQIAGYALLLVAISLGPVATGSPARSTSSPPSLGAVFVGLAVALIRSPSRPAARRLYLSSLAYLALLFVAMAADRVL